MLWLFVDFLAAVVLVGVAVVGCCWLFHQAALGLMIKSVVVVVKLVFVVVVVKLMFVGVKLGWLSESLAVVLLRLVVVVG